MACDKGKLFSAAHNVNFSAILAYPDRNGRTPITLTGEAPVDKVFNKVAHSARADCFGHPVYGSVVLYYLVTKSRNLDEP